MLYLTLIRSAETSSSRSAAVEELLASPHKKELLFLFFLERQKRKEVHVQRSLGEAIWSGEEEETGKKTETWKDAPFFDEMKRVLLWCLCKTFIKLLSYYFDISGSHLLLKKERWICAKMQFLNLKSDWIWSKSVITPAEHTLIHIIKFI